MCDGTETFKIATDMEFGWKEQAWEAMEHTYKGLHANSGGDKDAAQVLEEMMPLITHVRAQGGHPWDKDAMIAQMSWWSPTVDNTRSTFVPPFLVDGLHKHATGSRMISLAGVSITTVPEVTEERELRLARASLEARS